MNIDKRIELVLTKCDALRGEINKLESFVNTCNSEAVLQMHKTKEELNSSFNTELIHI